MQNKELIARQEELAKICLDNMLYVPGFAFEHYFNSVLKNHTDRYLIHVLSVDGWYVSAAVLDTATRILGVFTKPAFRRSGYGRQVVRELFQEYQIDPKTVFGTDGLKGDKKFFTSCGVIYFPCASIPLSREEVSRFVSTQEINTCDLLRRKYEKQPGLVVQQMKLINGHEIDISDFVNTETDSFADLVVGNQYFTVHAPLQNNFFESTDTGKFVAYAIEQRGKDFTSGKDPVELYRSKSDALEAISSYDDDRFDVYRIHLKPVNAVEFMDRECFDNVLFSRKPNPQRSPENDSKYVTSVYTRAFYDLFFIRGSKSEGGCDLIFLKNFKFNTYSVERVLKIQTF